MIIKILKSVKHIFIKMLANFLAFRKTKLSKWEVVKCHDRMLNISQPKCKL